MATTKATSYSNMINDYLPYELFEDSFRKQDWLWEKCTFHKDWAGGELIVPFVQAIPSSVKMGALVSADDIAQGKYVRGTLSSYVESYGALMFNSRDLMDHGKLSAQNFLKLVPNQIDQLMKFYRQTASIQILGGPHIDTVATAFDTATDVLAVKHPERFQIDQKITVNDGTNSMTGYVKAINKNTGVISFVTTRGGSTAVDLATITEATAKIYTEGGTSTSFGSLKKMVLTAAAGGSDTYCGQTKTDSPFTQSVLYDAGGTSANTGDWNSAVLKYNNILDLIFDAMRKGYQLGAEPRTFIMSYKHYSACLKTLESGAGAYKNIKPSVSYANYMEMDVGGVQGGCNLVAVREMDDDWICGLDPKHLAFHTANKPFTIMSDPDGKKFYSVRATTGYTYITDIQLVGDFLLENPWHAVGIHNIPDYKFNSLS
jgi:hypothetical protein